MRIHALIPVKGFSAGKTRLSGALDDDARAEVARWLLGRVVGAALESGALDGITVATNDAGVASAAGLMGVEVLLDPPGAGLIGAVDAGLAVLSDQADAGIVLMGDLPLITPADMTEIVGWMREPGTEILLVPDRSGHGCNVLGARPPGAIGNSFGHPESLARHREAALAAGLHPRIRELPRVAFDLDRPDDLRQIEARLSASLSSS